MNTSSRQRHNNRRTRSCGRLFVSAALEVVANSTIRRHGEEALPLRTFACPHDSLSVRPPAAFGVLGSERLGMELAESFAQLELPYTAVII